MIGWLIDQLTANGVQEEERDLLELYCSGGNFTLPAAPFFRGVLATELLKESIAAARVNAGLNGITHVDFVRMSGEETRQALGRERAFKPLSTLPLESYDFSTVLVDLPRAGLGEHMLAFLQGFDRIIYFSCAPISFQAKLRTTHAIEALVFFDQFPYTHPIESAVVLVRAPKRLCVWPPSMTRSVTGRQPNALRPLGKGAQEIYAQALRFKPLDPRKHQAPGGGRQVSGG